MKNVAWIQPVCYYNEWHNQYPYTISYKISKKIEFLDTRDLFKAFGLKDHPLSQKALSDHYRKL